MKILFYDWSLHTIGGGQIFNCKIIEHLSKEHEVDVITLFPLDKNKLEQYYGVNLSKINIISIIKNEKINQTLLRLLVSGRISRLSSKYDLFFNADGQEIVKPLAKYNVLYCHFFETPWYRPARNFADFLKLILFYVLKKIKGNYSKEYRVYCNSKYTQKWIRKLWNVESQVIYPPIDIPKKLNYKKKELAISTGRITPDKNYEFIIKVFKEAFKDPALKNYKLLICGAGSNEKYLLKLKGLAEGFPIEFHTDLSRDQLSEIYSESKVFLQAKGMNIDEEKYPALLEHFGMTVVEAMSYGCVPIVLNKGGYKETVDKKTGLKFDNESQAIRSFLSLAKNKKKWSAMSKNSIAESKKFSLERMQEKIDSLIKDIQLR